MAKQSKMIRPAMADVEVNVGQPDRAAKPRRRSSHGIVCACGSQAVEIDRTMDLSRRYPAFMLRGVRRIRRYCRCVDCGQKWSQEHDLTDRRVK